MDLFPCHEDDPGTVVWHKPGLLKGFSLWLRDGEATQLFIHTQSTSGLLPAPTCCPHCNSPLGAAQVPPAAAAGAGDAVEQRLCSLPRWWGMSSWLKAAVSLEWSGWIIQAFVSLCTWTYFSSSQSLTATKSVIFRPLRTLYHYRVWLT